MELIRRIITLIILIIAVYMDRKCARISNRLILAGFGAGGILFLLELWLRSENIYRIIWSHVQGRELLWGIVLPLILLWIPFRIRGIGAGDVKLFIVLGCLNGGADAFYSICFSFLLAAGISLSRLLSHRQLLHSLSLCISYIHQIFMKQQLIPWPGPTDSVHRLTMAQYILAGYLICLGVNICRTI